MSPKAPWAQYARAVEDARGVGADRVSTSLVPIRRSTPELQWDDRGRVLMVTWTHAYHYEGAQGQTYSAPVDLWFTPAPFLQDECRSFGLSGDALHLRIAQVLGLPPNATHDAFVEIWVDPEDLFRPCPDPEIGDRECQPGLSVVTDRTNRKGAGCPWGSEQTSEEFVRVAEDHLAWMCAHWRRSFEGDPRTLQPWTALGYTYDWGRPEDPFGHSEYVLPAEREVTVRRIVPTQRYCR